MQNPRRAARSRPQHRRPPRIPFGRLFLVLLLVMVAVVAWKSGAVGDLFGSKSTSANGATQPGGGSSTGSGPGSPGSVGTNASGTGGSSASPSPADSGATTINPKYPGLYTFRGNYTRTYYGEGPLPKHPKILWRYPASGGLCSTSSDNHGTRVWCGTGWTGQPNVIPHPNGTIEIREGAYDGHYHFLNGLTGQPMRPDLVTGDLAKGSATSDSDGYPLYYGGSRDNYFRVIALDRSKPTVLWQMSAYNVHQIWNNDWDGAALQVGDYLLEGGENSWFYVIRLNRHYDGSGMVQVSPKIVAEIPGYDQQLFNDLGDDNVSIENSVSFDKSKGVVYFDNSGGLVQGWNISDLLKGGTHYNRVFRFWYGNEGDSSVVIDDQGFIYAANHLSSNIPNRPHPGYDRWGSLVKLDPSKPNDPVVWGVHLGGTGYDGGVLGTPAIYKGMVYVSGYDGTLAGIDQKSGHIVWRYQIPGPVSGSPVTIDDQLVIGDCSGFLHDFDISQPNRVPQELWKVKLEGCIESTPAVWHGMLWVGSRGGGIYGIGDPK